ncbi:MAG: TRAP transporter large permease [Alphaproteobacteria bacterium]|nr:TRAP transporter large permease [Alphaproteobacteria bacterium]
MEYLPLVLMLVLFALNVPIAMSMGIGAISYFVFKGDEIPLELFAQRLINPTDSFPLLAVPFYVLASVIMNYAGITRRLMALAESLVGHMTGALAQVTVLVSTLMGGLSASANADAAMDAKMIGPQMIRHGYSPAFTAAISACSAVITPIIPPGIGFILYGFIADVSIGRLFMGGVVPGLMLCSFLMVTVHIIARKRGYKAQRSTRAKPAEIGRALVDATGALSILLFIMLGIRYGIFTPTEAGALAAVYAIFVGAVWHRELKAHHVFPILLESVLAVSLVMLIICCATAFGYYMTWERIPPRIAAWIVSITNDKYLLLLLINLLLLFVGMLIEGTAALILLTPILVPVVVKVGVDPVHFGLIMVLNLTIGGVTPPVGTLMFTTCAILRVPLEAFTREALPFIGAMLLVLMLVTYVPGLALWLPNRIFG